MKVIHLNYTDIKGGAGRAAYRIHRSLCDENIDSKMWVNKVYSNYQNIKGPSNLIEKSFVMIKFILMNSLIKNFGLSRTTMHSLSVLPSNWLNQINSSDADIVHLHWVQGEMISISDIGKIQKPIVWTLHDMWAFCGAEHYAKGYRWRDGYNLDNKTAYESGFDFNRWTWLRKIKHWKTPMQIVTPSKWLYSCVKESKLMSNWPVSVIPNPIDNDYWKQLNKENARKQLNLPINVPLILFGAMDGNSDPRKGFDLLINALEYLKKNSKISNLELVAFGQNKKQSLLKNNFSTHYIGHINNDQKLRLLYNATDAVVIPSRQDNLPNIGVEAQSCATPVIAFDIGGLSDIVLHKQTGYLANPFNVRDLADGIVWVLENNKMNQLSYQSKQYAISNFSCKKIALTYLDIYNKILKS